MYVLGIIVCVVMVFTLISPVTHIAAIEDVKWKTFKEKNGLFTMDYPSNWIPGKSRDNPENPSPIDMYFVYSGSRGSNVASLSVTADESIYTNVPDYMDSLISTLPSKFKPVQPVECTKYMIKGVEACSFIVSYKNTDVPGKPTIMEMDVVIIDEFGVQYVMSYSASKNLYDDYLPVAEQMIKSFNSGNILSPDDSGGQSSEGTSDSPQLPPVVQAPGVKKL